MDTNITEIKTDAESQFCQGKAKCSNCSRDKWAVTAVCLCVVKLYMTRNYGHILSVMSSNSLNPLNLSPVCGSRPHQMGFPREFNNHLNPQWHSGRYNPHGLWRIIFECPPSAGVSLSPAGGRRARLRHSRNWQTEPCACSVCPQHVPDFGKYTYHKLRLG